MVDRPTSFAKSVEFEGDQEHPLTRYGELVEQFGSARDNLVTEQQRPDDEQSNDAPIDRPTSIAKSVHFEGEEAHLFAEYGELANEFNAQRGNDLSSDNLLNIRNPVIKVRSVVTHHSPAKN